MDSVILEKKKLYDTLLSFPPFFTFELQQGQAPRTLIIQTQTNQLLGLDYSQLLPQVSSTQISNNIINSSISQISNLPIVQDNSTGIQKKLSKEEITIIMKELQKNGCVEFQFGSQKLLISHFSPYEMADDMYKWAKDNYLIGDVQTLQFIAEGEHTTPKHKFYKQPKQILIKVIEILQKSNKAAKIEIGNDISVKFL